jgi:hypothetical protein
VIYHTILSSAESKITKTITAIIPTVFGIWHEADGGRRKCCLQFFEIERKLLLLSLLLSGLRRIHSIIIILKRFSYFSILSMMRILLSRMIYNARRNIEKWTKKIYILFQFFFFCQSWKDFSFPAIATTTTKINIVKTP